MRELSTQEVTSISGGAQTPILQCTVEEAVQWVGAYFAYGVGSKFATGLAASMAEGTVKNLVGGALGIAGGLGAGISAFWALGKIDSHLFQPVVS